MTEDLRLAVIVNPDLAPGLLANTVGAVAIGLGACMPLLAAARLTDREGRTIDISANRPVPILQADADAIRVLMLKSLESRPEESAVVPFPAFARALHAYRDYEARFPDRDLREETIDGLGIAGPTKWIRSLTGSLKLLR